MMIYAVFAIVLIAYFELLGRWIAYKSKTSEMQFYFAIGFFAFLAFTFIFTSVLTSNNCSFYLILCIYLLAFLISIFLIFKDFERIRHKYSAWYLIVVLLIAIVLTYYSYNTTLGNPSSFDGTFYANFVTNNIGNNVLNSKDVYFNTEPIHKMTYYNTETYYYFVSYLLYVFGKISTLLNLEFFYLPAFVWIFQILYNFLLSTIIIESFNLLAHKKKLSCIVISFILIFVFGKFYYNSALGFIGNSLRTLAVSFAMLFLYQYFEYNIKNNRYIFYICLLASCALSTTGLFITLLCLFSFFFLAINRENTLIIEFGLIFAVPLYCLCNMELHIPILMYSLPILLIVVAYIVNRYLLVYLKKDAVLKAILVLSTLVMFILSRRVSTSLFDFTAFFNNNGSTVDMVQAYFNLSNTYDLNNIYKILVLILLFGTLVFDYKKPIIMMFIILILVIFNPFCCPFINKIINVYYRAYEIIINPFSLMMFAMLLSNRLTNKYVYSIVCVITMLLFVLKIDFINPHYWHYSFDPNEGINYIYKDKKDQYDYVNKMGKYEFDIIKHLKDNIYYYGEVNPYIITGNLLTQSMLPMGKYLYGRSYMKNPNWCNDELQLYYIFYPVAYWNEKGPMEQDFDNMEKYIKNCGINYLVVDKNTNYLDPEQNVWYSLVLKVNKECNTYPIYENERFALYHFIY